MICRITLQFLLLLAISGCALGCTCVAETFAGRYRAVPTVVKARVLSVKIVTPPAPSPCLDGFGPCLPPPFFPRPVKYTFRLLGRFKGCPPRRIFFGESADNSAACGVRLSKGRVYMLNLGMHKGTKKSPFGVSLCQENVLFGRLSKANRRFLRNQSKKKKNMCMM